MYFSVFENEQELLKAILDLNNINKIELDPMYNKGKFYKKIIEKPEKRYDLNAEKEGYDAISGDATKLPIISNSINSMILDPPFMFGIHGQTKNNKLNKRYTMFDNYKELRDCYKGIIKEAYRILKPKGLLIFKCQDYTDSRTTMTHNLVYNWARKQGFYAKDIVLLIKKNKIYNPALKQRHFRKVHNYFYIFIKK
jgi:hypothetical protein